MIFSYFAQKIRWHFVQVVFFGMKCQALLYVKNILKCLFLLIFDKLKFKLFQLQIFSNVLA